ncbi:MAG: glycosyltransferase [Caldilineaceae bacterium]
MRPQRILILMSNTGGGHRASAEALKAGFTELYGDQFQVEIIDLLMEHLPRPLSWLPQTYSFLVNEAAWLWKLLWMTGNHPITIRRLSMIVARLGRESVARGFVAYQPDLIISVHPLVQEFTLYALRQIKRPIPFVTVVTDLATAHPLWFHPAVDACYVASEEAYHRARRVGLRPKQLYLYGLPVRPAFAMPPEKDTALRQKLNLDPHLPAVLIMSGGEGVGPVEEIAQKIAAQLGQQERSMGQMVVICGRNTRLRQKLSNRTWPIPTLVHGFVENMPEWTAACDCIVTKAGPGTIAEALISGLPIILSGFIPGQEEGNIPYVLENEVGLYGKSPDEIATIVYRWFTDQREELNQMAARARRLGKPQATFQIVTSIVQLLELQTPLAERPTKRVSRMIVSSR